MKTTVELPDDLLMAAKSAAAKQRTTLRQLIETGLRSELLRHDVKPTKKKVRWVTVAGGLPAGLDVSDRIAVHALIDRMS